MNKTDLIRIVARRTGTPQRQTAKTINCLLDCIQKGLRLGDKIVLRGFGTFSVKELAPRKIWNPLTEEYMDIPKRKKVRFEPGKI